MKSAVQLVLLVCISWCTFKAASQEAVTITTDSVTIETVPVTEIPSAMAQTRIKTQNILTRRP